jgi:hypothetical protein
MRGAARRSRSDCGAAGAAPAGGKGPTASETSAPVSFPAGNARRASSSKASRLSSSNAGERHNASASATYLPSSASTAAAIDRAAQRRLVRCTCSARLKRSQTTPTMTRLSGSAKPSTSRIRRAEMLKWLKPVLRVERRGVSRVERKSRAVQMSHRRERLCGNAEVPVS